MIEKHCINARYGKHKWVEPVGKNKRRFFAGIRICKYCSRVERVATTEQEDSFDPGCSERLRSWAQNEEMIDQYFTDHGKDCNEAVKEIERLTADVKERDKLIDYKERQIQKERKRRSKAEARVEKLKAAMRKAANERYFNAALQVLADAFAATEQGESDG